MAGKKVTLIIQDTDARVLVTRGEKVETWANIPLEPGMVSAGVILKEDSVASLLKEQLKLLKVTSKRIIIGLSGLNSLYRLITLPELPESMLPEAVKREAERLIPVPLSDVYLSYQRVPSVAGEARIFMATYPRDATDSLVRTLRKAGLEPYLMDLAPLALSRTVSAPRAILVNSQASNLDIVIMVDRVPQVIRSISMAEVEQTERLSLVAEEIQRTVTFYNSPDQQKPLDNTVPLLVSGELATETENMEMISAKLGYSASALLPPLEAPGFFDAYQFMANIGLAFKEAAREKGFTEFSLVNFNALPEAYIPKHISLPNVLAPVSIIVSAGLVAAMIYTVSTTGPQVQALRSQLTTVEGYVKQQQRDVTAAKAKLKQLDEQLAPIESKGTFLNERLTVLKDDHARLDGDLGAAIRLLPSTIQLDKSLQNNEELKVNGVATDKFSVYEYARDLINSNRFTSVVITSIEMQKTTGQPPPPEELEGAAEPSQTGITPIVLKWADKSDNEMGFRLERATDAAFTLDLTQFTIGPNITSFIDTTADPGTTFYYRVFAYNIAGDSGVAGPIDVSTPAVEVPGAPGDLTVAMASSQKGEISVGPQVTYSFEIVMRTKAPEMPKAQAPAATPAPARQTPPPVTIPQKTANPTPSNPPTK